MFRTNLSESSPNLSNDDASESERDGETGMAKPDWLPDMHSFDFTLTESEWMSVKPAATALPRKDGRIPLKGNWVTLFSSKVKRRNPACNLISKGYPVTVQRETSAQLGFKAYGKGHLICNMKGCSMKYIFTIPLQPDEMVMLTLVYNPLNWQ